MDAVLVEDDRDLRAALAESLHHLGFDVKQADSGPQGLKLALKKPAPDVIVLDQNLPELKGADVARKVRSTRSRARIFLISGDRDVADVAEKAGIQFWLRKPFQFRDLKNAIENAMKMCAETRPKLQRRKE